ncbi:MAG TPA: hypothetical protein VIL74_10635 [Pyrinomonadaceae bacterium]|jgi:hypothetical protein
MRKIYIWAWALTTAAVSISVLTGTFDATAMIVFGLVGLGLIYLPALWTVAAAARRFASMTRRTKHIKRMKFY